MTDPATPTDPPSCPYCPTCVDRGWLLAVQELLRAGVIESRTSLLRLRLELRGRTFASPGHRPLAADVLAGVCERLVDLGDPRAYYEGRRRPRGRRPDDLSGLDAG